MMKDVPSDTRIRVGMLLIQVPRRCKPGLEERRMVSMQLNAAAKCLFAACALTAALDVLVDEDGVWRAFRMLCGLSVAVCAVRLAMGLLGSSS